MLTGAGESHPAFDPSSTWLAEARSAPPVTWRTSPSERPLGPSPPKPAQDTADTPPRCRRPHRLPRAELSGERRVLLEQRVFEFGEFSPLPFGQLHPASSRRPLPRQRSAGVTAGDFGVLRGCLDHGLVGRSRDLDASRLGPLRYWDAHGQHTVVVGGADVVGVDAIAQ